MAIKRDAYSPERYLAAGSVMIARDQIWFTVNDIDKRADLYSSLKPEIESLDAMDILESHYSAIGGGKKHKLEDQYFGDFKRAREYFNVTYGGDLRSAVQKFDEQDLEELEEELEVLDILS